jgi:hypothetical protein
MLDDPLQPPTEEPLRVYLIGLRSDEQHDETDFGGFRFRGVLCDCGRRASCRRSPDAQSWPGGRKFVSSEQLEWMPGGFFLLAYSYAGGKLAELTVIGYDANAKVFTHTSYTSSGKTELWRGGVRSMSRS